MADILDKRPVDAEMTIFKTEVEPNKLNACIDNILMRVDRLETKFADVQPVKRGRWEEEHYSELLWCYEATCSECGYESTDKYRIIDSHRFCENCGAIMEPIMEQED